jgi:predicted aspartyl protease
MKRSYSRDFVPPAPMWGLGVTTPFGKASVSIEGKLDSGADVCALPETVIAELDLPPVREVRASGFSGVLEPTLLYRCAVELGGRRFENVEALATRRRYAIIGRNVLRHLVVKLDGPKSELTLTHARSRKRGKRRTGERWRSSNRSSRGQP